MGQRLSKVVLAFTLIWNLAAFPGASLAHAPATFDVAPENGILDNQSQAEGSVNQQTSNPSPQMEPFRAEFVSQSANPRLLPGESNKFTLSIKNVGQAGWLLDTVRLGTDRPRDRIPDFIREDLVDGNPSGWISENRVRMAADVNGQLLGDADGNGIIDAGETATFEFWYSVPTNMADGLHREYFNLVADRIAWFNDLGIFWDITVDNAPHARFVDQNAYPPTLKAGASYEYWVRFENTGHLPWKDTGPTPVHLGTDRPMDRIPGFVREDPAGTVSGWAKENRVKLERDVMTSDLVGDLNGNDQIDQGEVARFRFWYTVPSTMESGEYKEYFRPVMDNRDNGWMEDFGLFWTNVVDNIAPRPAGVTITPQVNRLDVQWSAVPEATSFRVRYRPVGGDVFTILDFPASITSASIDVTGGQNLEVGVASVDAEGVSPFTSQIVHVESPEEAQARIAQELQQAAIAEQPPAAEIAPAPPAPEPPTAPEIVGAPATPEQPRDWRRFWLTLLILLGAAGLATAGYYGYEWWAEARRRPGPPSRPEPPKREPPKKEEPPRREEPPRTRW